MTRLRVLLVDDSATVRLIVSRQLLSDDRIADVRVVSSGDAALERVSAEPFDVVILDQEMPGMEGLETLTRILQLKPTLPVVMFSSLTQRGAKLTLEALAKGARAYVTKPTGLASKQAALESVRTTLLETILALRGEPLEPRVLPSRPPPEEPRKVPPRRLPAVPVECVVIAASTGGPNVVSQLVEGLPRGIQVPVLIVQHMPPVFTKMFAARLDRLNPLGTREASAGSITDEAKIWVAPGDFHMKVTGKTDQGDAILGLDSGPRRHGCRPCADLLFESAVEVYGAGVLGVVLTGMGRDGFSGAGAIVEAGGRVLAQDEPSSVVWSMPGTVVRGGLADKVLSPAELVRELEQRLTRRRSFGEFASRTGEGA